MIHTGCFMTTWDRPEPPIDRAATIVPPTGCIVCHFGITATCREYLALLIQGEDYPSCVNGLPDYVSLKNIAVEKKLPALAV